jgi:hypothetical protein
MPARGRKGHGIDSRAFDQKLVDRALHLLLEYQKDYSFAIVRCTARPFMKRAADLQEEVMTKGIHPDSIPQFVGSDTVDQGGPGLQGYG